MTIMMGFPMKMNCRLVWQQDSDGTGNNADNDDNDADFRYFRNGPMEPATMRIPMTTMTAWRTPLMRFPLDSAETID